MATLTKASSAEESLVKFNDYMCDFRANNVYITKSFLKFVAYNILKNPLGKHTTFYSVYCIIGGMQIKICKGVDLGFHLEKEADRCKDIKMTKVDAGEVISYVCV